MANEEHLAILEQGVDVWNEWRKANPDLRPDLTEADLSEANLIGANLIDADLWAAFLNRANLKEAFLSLANLSGANLSYANLQGAILMRTNLSYANLREANLHGANLREANLTRANLGGADLSNANLINADLSYVYLRDADLIKADLSYADLNHANLMNTDFWQATLIRTNLSYALLWWANFTEANFTGANLTKVDLWHANLVKTNFSEATLEDCQIYGVSVWDAKLEGTIQKNLNIAPEGQAEIIVDDLEVAQFIYLLLNNSKLRNVIDTMGNKAVLILGRFTEERKASLDAIRDALRAKGYLPILFDFEKPSSRDLTETILTLASLSRFIIADLTDAKSIPQELKTIVPNLLSVAVQPIILKSQREYAMFEHIARFPSVLTIHEYESQDNLIKELAEKVIQPAEQKANEMRPKPLS